MSDQPEGAGRLRLLSLRVSRDSGRTWGPERRIWSGERLAPLASSAWPPCLCPRCRRT
ncbi:hypothetical protein A4G23_02649 [Streptomyces rubrolavendulae]|uniref:Exo-alpha-sialidase n=2 Tax=Streptomyces TaxID=1883 RepID=A0A1D8G2X7_9ACTN|nr:hypothetical protein A4G23_02649 [Streptomyces rubrolavendulae]OSY53543.1 hypothetical protein BG846_00817 [Streptomyces fradiae ATCC 10745 = DSM 40063]